MTSSSKSRIPVLQSPRPAFKVGSFEQAVDHYVNWLGFQLDWEWREAPGQPAVASLSRDHCAFMINEHSEAQGPISIHVDVTNLDTLIEEWNARRPDSVEAHIAPPYEFPEVAIADPWGNTLFFEGKDEAAEREKQETIRPRMRSYVEQKLKADGEFPTPEQIRDAIGPPLGTAIEVLNEFPDYGEAFDTRRSNSSSSDGTNDPD